MEPSDRPALLELTLEQTEALVADCGASPVHARALRRVLLRGGDPATGTRAPQRLIDALVQRVDWTSTTVARSAAAADGSEKVLVRMRDGNVLEAVRLPGTQGGAPSACLSSQVGCAMACRFCASGLDAVARNASVADLLEQLVHLRRIGPVERLVFMGSGEPTQNHRNLARALDVLRDEAGIGPKHVIVSTVGPPGAIDRLAALDRRFTLALSLHAPTRELRSALIPTQSAVEPAALLDAADRFAARHRKPYQIEYVLLRGVNDGSEHARALAALLGGRRAHVSVIPYNAVEGLPFGTPSDGDARSFVDALHAADVSARVRRTVGREAVGACGQLRARELARS